MKLFNLALTGLTCLSLTACMTPESQNKTWESGQVENDTLYASSAPRLHPQTKTPLAKPTQFMFSHSQTSLSKGVMSKLNLIAESMLANPYAMATVSGERGAKQAQMVIAYLEAQGIPANRFQKKVSTTMDAASPSMVSVKLRSARA